MLNMNSPTVQAMLNNTPNGIGNMPVYYGNTPTVTTDPSSFNTPYPSPKEMLTSCGQSNIYAPVAFGSPNTVGGYNPGFQAAFAGYSNPYMGYGSYYGNGYMYPPMPMDEETRQTLELARMNGLEYNEQVQMESELYKKMSRTVSKGMGRSEEEAAKCEEAFNPKNRFEQETFNNHNPITPMHVALSVGGKEVQDFPSGPNYDRLISTNQVGDMIRARDTAIKTEIAKTYQNLYVTAPERNMDNADMVDFFNNHAGSLMMDDLRNLLQYQCITRTSKIYDSEKFGKLLLENNGFKSKNKMNAIDRFTGRYGVMPDGRPVFPGHDPSIAESFSYDMKTGQYNVTPPNFLRDRLDKAREAFIRSIDND